MTKRHVGLHLRSDIFPWTCFQVTFFLCVTPCVFVCGHSLFGKTFVPTDEHSFAAHKIVTCKQTQTHTHTHTHAHLNPSENRKYLIGSFRVGSRPRRQNNIKKNYIYISGIWSVKWIRYSPFRIRRRLSRRGHTPSVFIKEGKFVWISERVFASQGDLFPWR